MKFIQNYNQNHAKIEFGMIPGVILYELHTSDFTVLFQNKQIELINAHTHTIHTYTKVQHAYSITTHIQV